MEFSEIDFREYSLILFIISLLAIGGSFFLSIYTNMAFSTWINTTGTVGSIFLSGLLVYLYFNMGETQRNQFEVQEAQAKLLENQQKPQLRFDSVEIYSGTELAVDIFDEYDGTESTESSDFYPNATGIRCTIQNTGGGPAEDLELNIDVYLSDLSHSTGLRHLSEAGYRFSTAKLDRVNGSKLSSKRLLMGAGGETLSPGESDTFYAFTGTFNLNIGLNEFTSLVSVSPVPLDEILPNDADQMVLIEVDIKYKYAKNSIDDKVLYRVIAPADEVTKLYEIEDYGRPMDPDLLQALMEETQPRDSSTKLSNHKFR